MFTKGDYVTVTNHNERGYIGSTFVVTKVVEYEFIAVLRTVDVYGNNHLFYRHNVTKAAEDEIRAFDTFRSVYL